MLVHSDPLFTIFFGDKRDCFDLPRALEIQAPAILDENPFKKLIRSLKLYNLIFLRQMHNNNGLLITSKAQATALVPFMWEGDFLVTNIPRIGLGIAAADCIPIIIFDKMRHVIAIVHAGWRGSIAQVAVKAIEKMQKEFQVQLENVRIFMGPSAKGCCYVVGQNVLTEIERYSYYEEIIYKTQGKIYVDLPLFNCLLLEKYGIKKEAFHLSYNLCTICDFSFCSYRRNGPMQWRQMNVVMLK